MSTTTTTSSIPTKEECAALWSKFDYNGNGMLSLAELDKAVMEMWPELNHKPAIMRAYQAADREQRDGFIRKKEFRFFLTCVHLYNQLWTTFAHLDDDSDRRLTRQEFHQIASAVGDVNDPDQVFDEMDVNQGGVILFDEFCTWWARSKIGEEVDI